MMAWTDRHCRFLHRLVAPSARLYTEMLSTDALLHGDAERLLAFDRAEHPVAAQIGGSDPAELAKAARLVERAGFDEVNLNVGCPSARVQRGGIGACLMREPQRVADGVAAMRDAVTIPVTVKCRIGVTDTVAGEPSAGERPRREAAGRGIAPRMKEPSAGEREGLAPRMKEPSAGERE
ncbi:MAG: tRNA-dihydrouridine synthase, partial [Gammaproteobacteria bacterium]|nr:tRNA-dihydrouridine synthase [Gammaproteobacteria bacterium]